MLKQKTIEMELARIKKALKQDEGESTSWQGAMLYGAQQALGWALGHDAAKPTNLLKLSSDKEEG